MQPLVSLHPLVIWSEFANPDADFLVPITVLWFLPFILHVGIDRITRLIKAARYKVM
jgi:hypothetical protein